MKVLFIGNSYTYYNDMPEIFKAMSQSAGIPCEVKALTRGGAWLWQYEKEDDEVGMQIRETIKQNWNYVVFQDNSFGPVGALVQFMKASGWLSDLARKHGAIPVLYQTMAYQIDHPRYQEYGMTQADMHQRLRTGYQAAAARHNALLSPAGEAMYRAIGRYGALVHNEDRTHPSYMGSYLIAAVHCGFIMSLDPRKISFTGELDEATAKSLLEIAAYTLGYKD